MNDKIIKRVLNHIATKAKENPNHYGWQELYATTGKSDVESLLGGEVLTDVKISQKLTSIASSISLSIVMQSRAIKLRSDAGVERA
jgi:hypothetical protein